jgi:hypothetical protein
MRTLDPDHFGPKVGKVHRHQRTGPHGRDVEDSKPLQGGQVRISCHRWRTGLLQVGTRLDRRFRFAKGWGGRTQLPSTLFESVRRTGQQQRPGLVVVRVQPEPALVQVIRT